MGKRSKFGDLTKEQRELEAMRRYLGLGTQVVTPLIEQHLVPMTTVKRAGWSISMWILPLDGFIPELMEIFISVMDRRIAWASAIQAIPKTHKLHWVVDAVYEYEVKEWYPEGTKV